MASELSKSHSSVFWLDREVIGDVLAAILRNHSDSEEGRSRRLIELVEEGWDLFLRVLGDGSIVVTAVAVRTPYWISFILWN
jgi:hypothetical protein